MLYLHHAIGQLECDKLSHDIRLCITEEFSIENSELYLLMYENVPKTMYGCLSLSRIKEMYHTNALNPYRSYIWSSSPHTRAPLELRTGVNSSRRTNVSPLRLRVAPSHNATLIQAQEADDVLPMDPIFRSCKRERATKPPITGMLLEIDINEDSVSDIESASNSPSTPTSLPSFTTLPFLTNSFSDPHKDAKVKSVAVVGAGIMGITCAIELHARGYRVTLFDRESMNAPSKYCVFLEGNMCDIAPLYFVRGAQSSYLDILLRRLGVLVDKGITPFYFEEYSRTELIIAKELKRCKLSMRALADAVRDDFGSYCPSHHTLTNSKFGCRPVAKWLEDHPLAQTAAELLTITVTSAGLGYIRDTSVSTSQWLSQVLSECPDLRNPSWYSNLIHIPGGYPALWKAAHDYMGTGTMQLGVEVKKIERTEAIFGGVLVHTKSGEMHAFDDVVLACSAENSLRVLYPPSSQEKRWMECVYSPSKFYLIVARVTWPPGSPFNRPVVYWVKNCQSKSLTGHIVMHHCHTNMEDLVTFYMHCGENNTVTDMVRYFYEDLTYFRIKIRELILCRRCSNVECIMNAFEIDIPSIQGLQHTFFTGKYLCSSALTHQAEYAKSLIHERFPARLHGWHSSSTPNSSKLSSGTKNSKCCKEQSQVMSPPKTLKRLSSQVATQLARLIIDTFACQNGVSYEEALAILSSRGKLNTYPLRLFTGIIFLLIKCIRLMILMCR